MSFIKTIWKDPVWSKVIATAIISAFTILATWWGAQKFNLWAFFTQKTQLPNWLIFLLALSGIALVAILFIKITNNKKASLTFQSYTRDSFFDLNFEWSYRLGDEPWDFKTLCPECLNEVTAQEKTDFSHQYSINKKHEFVCSNCNYSASFDGEIHNFYGEVKKSISRKIRTGEWRTSLKQ